MQLIFQAPTPLVSAKNTYRSSALNSSTDTLNSSSSSTKSVDTMSDACFQSVAKWILSYNKKIGRDTQYLALSYLKNLRNNQIYLAQQSYQKLAVVLLLLASKMNEVYPPRISELLTKCKKIYTYEEIIALQGYILNILGFQTAIDSHTYAFIYRILKDRHGDKFQECEKLLRMVSSRTEFSDYGEQILGYAIIYLIIPDLVRSFRLEEAEKIKALAVKIYSMYTQAKRRRFDLQKQGRS